MAFGDNVLPINKLTHSQMNYRYFSLILLNSLLDDNLCSMFFYIQHFADSIEFYRVRLPYEVIEAKFSAQK